MFIAIYSDGNHVSKPDIETAFKLPGNYNVFSIGKNYNLNKEEGITYYNNEKKESKFRLNYLELIDIIYLTNYKDFFRFSIYDYQKDIIRKIDSKSNIIEHALSYVIKIIILASGLPSWDEYENYTKAEDYKKEIEKLKKQIDLLINKNNELGDEIVYLRKNKEA